MRTYNSCPFCIPDGQTKWISLSGIDGPFDYKRTITYEEQEGGVQLWINGEHVYVPSNGLIFSGYRSEGQTHAWVTSNEDISGREDFLLLDEPTDYAFRVMRIDAKEKDLAFTNFSNFDEVSLDGNLTQSGARYFFGDSNYPIGCYRFYLVKDNKHFIVDYFEYLGQKKWMRVQEWLYAFLEAN